MLGFLWSKSPWNFQTMVCHCISFTSYPAQAIYDFSIKRIIFDSLSLELQSRFRAYPFNASSLWQTLHYLFYATPIVAYDLEGSCTDSLSCELEETYLLEEAHLSLEERSHIH